MKAAFAILSSAFAFGCASAPQVLTIPQAREFAVRHEGSRVTIAGYFIHHFEGDELEVQLGEQTGDGIALRFRLALVEDGERSVLRSVGGLYHKQYVRVSGVLSFGSDPFERERAAIAPERARIYLNVERIERANKAPEPTPRPVTIPAEPGIAPGRVVAHL